MSHQITMTAGKSEMAYVGETPWHGLGQQLEAGASIETWAQSAGMEWKIQRSKVRYFADRDGAQQLEWPEQNVLFRSDTKAPLGLVSPKFKVVQPTEVLEFFRDLVDDSGFSLETAGTLFGGRRFWALASIGESAVISNSSDLIGGYLLLCTGADGTLATTARFTTVRVVCNNTLSMSLSGKAKQEVTLSHRSHFDAGTFKDQLGIAHGSFKSFIKEMRHLAEVPVQCADADLLTRKLLAPVGLDTENIMMMDEASEKLQASKSYQNIMGLFNGAGNGAKLVGVKDTAWGWVNAVTEHVDHHARAMSLDKRLDSAWFGKGDILKTRAVELAHALTA